MDQAPDEVLPSFNGRDSMTGTLDEKPSKKNSFRDSESFFEGELDEPSIIRQNLKTSIKQMDHAASDKGILIHSLCDMFSRI
jgi:hypothetical protein